MTTLTSALKSHKALAMLTNRRPIVAVDVDLTFVDTLTPYFEWFKTHAGFPVPPSVYEGHFDLNPIFAEYGVDGHAFWMQADLYDNLIPLPGATGKLKALSEHCDIVFVSTCYPEHIASKRRLLAKFCEFPFDFIDTDAKWAVDYAVLIDDSPTVMKKAAARRPGSLHLLFDTKINCKFDHTKHDMQRLHSWAEL